MSDNGDKKTGKSVEKTDWFGDKYIEHTDSDGNVTGRSEEKTDWFGDNYTQHTDSDRNATGRSEEKTDWFGDNYTQHTDSDRNATGRSEEKTDWFGDNYTQHTDSDRNATGRSEEKTDWFGDSYTKHSAVTGAASTDQAGAKSSFAAGMISRTPFVRGILKRVGTADTAVLISFVLAFLGYLALCLHVIFRQGTPDTLGEFAITIIALPGIILIAIVLFIVVTIMFIFSLFFGGA